MGAAEIFSLVFPLLYSSQSSMRHLTCARSSSSTRHRQKQPTPVPGVSQFIIHACSQVESQGGGIAAPTLPAARFVAEHSLPMNSGSISVQSRERDAGGCMEAGSLVSVHVQALVHPRETAGTRDEC